MKPSFFKHSVNLITFVAIWAFLPSLAMAQEVQKEKKENRREAFIRDFKNGVLLVRLQDREDNIKKIEDRGFHKEAENMRAEQRRENRETILSFGKTFDFCPVYFFYAKDSEAIRKGDFQGKVFNADFELVELKSSTPIFTAEFSETEKLGIDGLIVMDYQLLPMEDPLPYFQRRYVFFGLVVRSKAEMVESYNEKLHEYADMLL